MTARPLHVDLIAALDDELVRPIFLLDLEFDSEVIYLTDAGIDISWNSNLYLANGWLVDLQDITETVDIREQTIDITLTGAPEEINSLMFLAVRQNKIGRIRVGLTTPTISGITFIGDPYLVFIGRFDYPEIEDSNDRTTVTLHYTSHFADLDKASELRYTHDSQIQMFPGDLGFAYVATMVAGWDGYWGKGQKPPKRNNKSDRKNVPKSTR